MKSLGSISRERWSVLEPLLDAALELDPADRAGFLDDICHDDTALLTELRALLDACDLSDGLLVRPASVAYAPLLADPLATPPSLLGGRYRLGREVGRGGMATVYLADDPKHGRSVAVKVLHADVARRIGRERFLREIEIAARLSHPHVLPLHDSGEVVSERVDDPSFLYFVSPFVAGESLRDRLLREHRLAADEAVRLGRQIAMALDYAHRQGVIHLDIKPGNILLQEGHAVIADFGIARAMSTADDDPLRETPLLGTPSYMSPEQASNLPDVDSRSDIFSLGCVLYEMVTGERPRSRSQSQPDNRAAMLAEYVSPELARVITRAMAPSPDDRFDSGEDLARALADATQPRRARLWLNPKVLIPSALAVAGAGLLAFLAVRNTTLDADLIAVAPFDVEAPSLALWKEGLVDVMSRNLDGAGALRTVPASFIFQHWRGRADTQSATALGKASGARLVLFGGLLAAGDSVRATSVLFDATTGRKLAEIEIREVAGRIDRLSDSLTVAVLRELGHSRRIDMARVTASPTTSLPALKAYLQGEQFYRATLWDSAQARFERAISLDSTFALAYHRLAAIRQWRDPNEYPDSTAYELMRRTSHFARTLGPRERLLATIDSLSAEAYFAWRGGLRDARSFDKESVIIGRLIAAIGDGLVRYRHDPELSFLLAKARSRYDRDVLEGEDDDREILGLYDHAIAMDSSFAPAYITPISLAAYLDGPESARRYSRAYLALEPSGARSEVIHLADDLLDPIRSLSIDIEQLVDTLPPSGLCEATNMLRHVPDAPEMLVRIARAIARRPASDKPHYSEPTCALVWAIDGLQFRGHLREALDMTERQAHWMGPTVTYNMARVGMVPADSASAEFQRVLALSPRTKMTKLYGWWATDGDTASIRTYIDGFTRASATLRSPSGASMLRASIASGRGYLALAKRDTAAALRQFTTTADTLHECWYDVRVTTVQLLVATGRDWEAGQRLARRWPGTSGCSNGFDDILWTLERGRVFERLGRDREAMVSYQFVADAWRTADPELQPYVRESRDAIARIKARSKR